MIYAEKGSQLVAYLVRRPILNDTGIDGTIERTGGTPHQVCANIVVVRIVQHLGSFFNQREQNRLCLAIL